MFFILQKLIVYLTLEHIWVKPYSLSNISQEKALYLITLFQILRKKKGTVSISDRDGVFYRHSITAIYRLSVVLPASMVCFFLPFAILPFVLPQGAPIVVAGTARV